MASPSNPGWRKSRPPKEQPAQWSLSPVRREELAAYYRMSTVVVIPSWFEAFGLVAVEAMACGKPVVASDVGGLAETVRHGHNGYLFPVGDHVRLAGYVSHILSRPTCAGKWAMTDTTWSGFATALSL